MWTALISSVIKAEDSSRPLISGIHQLSAEKEHRKWTIENQAEHTDILVTHPYPFWSDHACFDKVTDIRVILYPAALSKFYSDTQITLDFEVSPDYKITKIYNYKQNKCAPYEAVIVKLERR